MSHNIGFSVIEYRVTDYSTQTTGKWKKLCNVPYGFKMTDKKEYELDKQIKENLNLCLSTVEIRVQ